MKSLALPAQQLAQQGQLSPQGWFGNLIGQVGQPLGNVIGGAFGKIVDSLVQDVIMPPIGRIFGGLDFANYYLPLNGQATTMTLVEAKKAGAVLAYGNFLTILLNFVILAFIIFQMVRLMNKARRSEPVAQQRLTLDHA